MSYGHDFIRTLGTDLAEAIIDPLRRTSRPEYEHSIEGSFLIPQGFPTPRPTMHFELEEFTPYACGEWGPLWAHRRYRLAFLVWAVQTSKTTIMSLACLDNFRHDPGMTLWVMASEDEAGDISQLRFGPLVHANFPGSLLQNDKLVKRFDSGDLVFGWAGSASRLASKPARYVYCDEVGKYRTQTSRETDAFRNASRRTQSYGEFGRVLAGTTPTDPSGVEWELMREGTNCHRYVKCPHCHEEQVMWFAADLDRCWFVKLADDTTTEPPYKPDENWKGGFVWDESEGLSIDQMAMSARYRCEHCGKVWSVADRNRIIHAAAGSRWKPWQPEASSYSCHLPSWYSKQVGFAQVVAKYLKAMHKGEDSPEMHDLLNNDCAVPFRPEIVESVEEGFLRRHQLQTLAQATVAEGSACVLGSVDFHARHFRVRVRAFAHRADGSSWGVVSLILPADYGQLDLYLRDARFPDAQGNMVAVNRWICDGNYDRNQVADLVAQDPERRVIAYGKTMHGANTYKHTTATVRAGTDQQTKIQSIAFDDQAWNGELWRRIKVDPVLGVPGCWWVENEVPAAYWQELAKARSKAKGGRMEWEVPDNAHFWDCEKLLCVLAESGGWLDYEAPPTEPERKLVEKVNPYTGAKYWVPE